MKPIYYLFIGLASVLVILIAAGVALFARPYTYHGSLIDPPMKIPNFQLTDQKGNLVQLSALRASEGESGAKGKVVLIFFGYTHCMDVCPTTMAHFKQIKAQLGSQAKDIQFVFISVDPTRDTPTVIDQYVSSFDPGFVGLTGSQSELEPVWKTFGVYVQKGPSDSSGNYEVSHTSLIYVLDPKGDLRLSYDSGADPQTITQDVEHLLKGQ